MADTRYYVLRVFTTNHMLLKQYVTTSASHNEKVGLFVNTGRGHPDAGFDLALPDDLEIGGGSISHKIGLAVQCSMEVASGSIGGRIEDVVGTPCAYYLRARSSTGSRTPIRLANSVGVIDSGYRGEIAAVVDNLGETADFVRGTRLFQLCPPDITSPMFVVQVGSLDELGTTERGERGFGSTGQ